MIYGPPELSLPWFLLPVISGRTFFSPFGGASFRRFP